MSVQPFQIDIAQSQLDDLEWRLRQTRWAAPLPGTAWQKGTAIDELKALVDYWLHQYDWRQQEHELNQLAHFYWQQGETPVHFIHQRGNGPNPLPLLLTHGWPDSFLRYQKIIPLLTDPVRFGGKAEDAFDVIVPSLPGFAFSRCPPQGIHNAQIADLWAQMMTELGYARFAAAGGDIGSGVTRYLAVLHPGRLVGIHLTDIGLIRPLMQATGDDLTDEARDYQAVALKWIAQEGAYMALQSTKPQTLAFALNDSPVGLASWIMEKFRSWGDCQGDLFNRFSKDELLNNIMLYWLTGSFGSSANLYYENSHSLPPIGDIRVPTGLARFPHDLVPPPRRWAEQHLNIQQWTEMPHGGHFTAMEEPELLAQEIRTFYRPLR
ncbi:epoxide hydrolase family protein [Pantoea sp. App145]|uniref:epoxide hydrolase family protein n=1 Tax=Pantoea sp. App145 TaxID=3071567 RepID=UPI003A807936